MLLAFAPRQITYYMRLDNSGRNPFYHNEILPVTGRVLYQQHAPTGTLSWQFWTHEKQQFEDFNIFPRNIAVEYQQRVVLILEQAKFEHHV